MACTPSACLNIGWTQEAAKPLALLLGFVPFLLVRARWATGWKRPLVWLGAVVALCAAFWNHQSPAMFFFVLLLVDMATELERSGVRTALRRALPLALSGASALVIALISIKLRTTPNVRAALAPDPIQKLHWFINEVLPNASTLASLPPARAIGWLITAGVGVGVLVALARRRWRSAAAPLLLLLGGPLVYLPSMVVADSWAAYRTLFALSALVILMFATGLRAALGGGRGLTAALVLLCAAGLPTFARQGRLYLTAPHEVEVRVVQEALGRIDPEHTQALYIILARPADAPAGRSWYDEFGLPSSCLEWAALAMYWTLAQSLPDAAHRAVGALPQTVSSSPPADLPDRTALLDLRELQHWRAAVE